ncbi:benzoate-CoA ligase family protein [Nonomuraea sp. NBC_01738]|uniref:benzoate-CoA ligase family protein n=1 Tax=Nonomuraea sp. NBC_01738 TaxID=2976003 RepID=UPI002E0E7E17|nr:benzoate-CoA ligase family protein [Nonomuraea sp. NBC_01738]
MSGEPFNASAYLLAAGRGDRIAVTGPAGALTYAELAARVEALSAGLVRAGVRPEERVVMVMSDRPETLALILAVMRIGAVAVPLSTMYHGDELAALVRDARAAIVVSTPEFEPAVTFALARSPEVTTLVRLSGDTQPPRPGLTVLPWSALSEPGGDTAEPYETWADSPALWLYTSGTTGAPKAAMHRHGAIRDVCETYAAGVLGVGADDRCFSVARLFFAYGLGNSLFFPLAAGATAVLDPARPTPTGVAERVRAERPTLFFAGPTFYAALLAADLPGDTFASVRLAVSAGEALPAEIQRRFTARFGVDILDGIGSTEALHIFISNRPGRIRPGTSGTPVPGYEARLLDDEGTPVKDGDPGHLHVRGASIASGYWCRTAATRQVFQGEWLRTGDTYVRDDDGYYTCLGRSNDMIKAGGIWVSPMEVEARLLAHASVGECAVVAYVDADGLEKPVACVVPAAGTRVDEDELIAFCREGLAAFKRPRAVLVLDELPKTATGKIQRVVLRRVAARELT